MFDRLRQRAVRLASMAGLLALLACHPLLAPVEPDAGATAATDTVWATFTWTAPTTGSAVAYYVIETHDGRTLECRHLTPKGGKARVPFTPGQVQRIRVAGVDAQGRQGPWSQWSTGPRLETRPEVTP